MYPLIQAACLTAEAVQTHYGNVFALLIFAGTVITGWTFLMRFTAFRLSALGRAKAFQQRERDELMASYIRLGLSEYDARHRSEKELEQHAREVLNDPPEPKRRLV